jgi:uncharacterized protein YcnI
MKSVSIALGVFLLAHTVSAHVVVKPNVVGVGMFQNFVIGVPSEKPVATVAVKLVIPPGLDYVTPNVKPGWNVEVVKNASSTVTEIRWTGGNIPAGMRDDFGFSAKVPGATTALNWKAYQTYADGSVVSWEDAPGSAATDFSVSGPYSVTRVVNDLDPTPAPERDTVTFVFAILAFIFSLSALREARKAR